MKIAVATKDKWSLVSGHAGQTTDWLVFDCMPNAPIPEPQRIALTKAQLPHHFLARGSAASLHHAWKTAQTLVEWASGIASGTAAIVEAAGGVAVACTRKNMPGTKALSVKAVRAGGGTMHRLGLSETLLVFAEHRFFLAESPAQTVGRLRSVEPEKKIVVEVATLQEASLWADAGADVLQLEKFTPEAVAACRLAMDRIGSAHRPLLAAAGGVRADNAAAYVAAGADFLVTSAPYTAPPRDVQVNFGSAT